MDENLRHVRLFNPFLNFAEKYFSVVKKILKINFFFNINLLNIVGKFLRYVYIIIL